MHIPVEYVLRLIVTGMVREFFEYCRLSRKKKELSG